ncbi:protein-tyrosine phosphatase-like protein [Zopfochytrium polystomum]|nr:protein-tyrosine phosphatase-like protein [Zopfochytrium polystomum]
MIGPSEVVPGIFISSVPAATDRDRLLRAGITHILNVTGPVSAADPTTPRYPNPFGGASAASADSDTGFAGYLHICLPDDPAVPLRPHIPTATAFISSALASGGAVLVHCEAGVSRSASFIAAFLMRERGLTLRGALGAVQAAAPRAAPNVGFFRQLCGVEAELAREGRLRVPPAEGGLPSVSEREYVLAQLLAGPAEGMDAAAVERAMDANGMDPDRTMEELFAEAAGTAV